MAHPDQRALPIEGNARSLPAGTQLCADGPGTCVQHGSEEPAQASKAPGLAAEDACRSALKPTVQEAFMLVVRTAQSLGLETGMGLDVHERQLGSDALPHIELTLDRLKKAIRALPTHAAPHLSLLDQLVQTQIAAVGAGGKEDAQRLDVERRGARTHIDPNTPHV